MSTRIAAVALAGALTASCGGSLAHERRPTRFSHGLIEGATPFADGHRTATKRKRPTRRRAKRRGRRPRLLATRALAQVGRRFPGPRRRATARLLARALGGRVRYQQLARRAASLDRRRRPRRGDLVFFRGGDRRPEIGVVVARRGSRVWFVYLCGDRARRGVLDTRWPHRRRRRGRIANSYVRIARPNDPRDTRYLAGQLLLGFAAIHAAGGTVR